MATGGDDGQTVSDLIRTFEESYTLYNQEFNCSVCYKEGKNIDAVVYCPQCGEGEYFCEECKKQHNRFGLGQQHVLIDRSQFERIVRRPNQVLVPKAKCEVPNHFGTLKTIYCESHRVDCCANCAVQEHGKCTSSLKFIPEEAKGLSKRKELFDLISCFRDIQNQFMELKLTVSTEKHELQLEQDSINDQIYEFKKKMNQQLEALELSTNEVLNGKFHQQEHHLNAEIRKIDCTLDKIENYLVETDRLRRSECELYVLFKKGGHLKEEVAKELTAKKKRKRRPQVRFQLEKKLVKIFDGLSILGNVSAQRDMNNLQVL